MPWTYQSSKDGFTVADIPDDVEIGSPEFVQLVTTMRGKSDSIGSAPATPPQETPQAEGPGFIDRMVATAKDVAPGIVRGAAPILTGTALGAIAGIPGGPPGMALGAGYGTGGAAGLTLIGDPAAALINSIAGEQVVTGPTEFVGDLLDRMGLARPETPAGRIAQATTQGVAGAGGMIGAGKTLANSSVPLIRDIGKNLSSNVPGQILGAATGSAASQGAAKLGGGTVAQLGAGLVGGLGGGFLGNHAYRTPTPIDPATGLPLAPATAARVTAMQEAETRGIPVRTSDIFPPESYFGKFAKTIVDKMPFTTGKMNANQAAARQAAVDDFMTQAGARGNMDESLGKATENLLKNRSDELARNVAAKADVMARANDAGPVNVAATTAEIDAQIDRLFKTRNPEVDPSIAQLRNLRDAIQNQSLDMVEANRRILGDKLKDPMVGPVMKNSLQKAATAIYRAMNQDMRAHIAGALDEPSANKWAVANKRIAAMIDDVDAARSRDILSIVRKGANDPGKMKKVLFNGTDSDLRTAYKYMDDQGRASARRAYIDKAIDVATAGRGLDAADPVSVDKFKNALQVAIKRSGPFFEGQDGQAAKGLIRSLDLTVAGPRANQLAQTGAMNTTTLLGTAVGSALGFAKVVGAIGGAGTLARAYESPAMRDALIRLAKTQRGSQDEYQAINRFMVQASVLADEDNRKKGAKK